MLFIEQSQNPLLFFRQKKKTKTISSTQRSLNKKFFMIYTLTLLENTIYIGFGRHYNKFTPR